MTEKNPYQPPSAQLNNAVEGSSLGTVLLSYFWKNLYFKLLTIGAVLVGLLLFFYIWKNERRHELEAAIVGYVFLYGIAALFGWGIHMIWNSRKLRGAQQWIAFILGLAMVAIPVALFAFIFWAAARLPD